MTRSNPNVVAQVTKTVAEDYDYGVDFSPWLTTGDTLTGATVKCFDGTTDVSSTLLGTVVTSTPVVKFEVKGGTAGKTYLYQVIAATTQADTWEALLYLKVI